ncbi:MAG: SDR family oxidoreductase [Oscillospiraceae bacterium]
MKNALITGSSRGIGAATARELASQGWLVNINYLNSEAAAFALASELGCPAYRADVSDPAQVRELFRKTGPVDLLVNNAGVAWAGLLSDMTDGDWRRLFSVNVDGAFNCCREAIPHMVRQKSGCIVNLSSVLGVSGGSCEAAYSATKGAIIALTKALAKELGPSGIRVNAVAPGAIDTDMLRNLTAADKLGLCEATALCRLGTAEDVARAIALLASDDAGFISGQILGVDGALVI